MKSRSAVKNFALNLLVTFAVLSLSFSAFAAQSKTVFVLFDVSDSTKLPDTQKRYINDFNVIMKAVVASDAIAADRISDSSVSGSTLPINHEFESVMLSNEIKTRKQKAQIMATANEIVNSKGSVKYTDILGSLNIAERVFRTYNKERNILVIMSDMVEDSRSYNFEKERLSDSRINAIIAFEKRAKRLPDLKGVKVYVITLPTNQSTDKFTGIENFWLRYLTECGAFINKAQYGPLTKFE